MSKKNRKSPQDRKPKATVVEAAASDFTFTFVHDGAQFTLPHPSAGAEKIPTVIVRDALIRPNDQGSQMALGFAMIDASDVSDGAVDALYAKPIGEASALIAAWMQSAGESVPKH